MPNQSPEQRRLNNNLRSVKKKCDAVTTIQGRPRRPGIKKGGSVSAKDKQFILSRAGKDPPEHIAHLIGRTVDQVRKIMQEVTGIENKPMTNLIDQLQMRPEWRQFSKQFNADELEEFKHQYVQMVSSQFKDDLLPTEELQVFQVITLKIQIDRTLAEQRVALNDMQAARQDIERLEIEEPDNKRKIGAARERYDDAQKVNRECADRYKIWSDKQDKMFHSLKSTRDQRVKVYENSKHSILGLVRLLMEEGQRETMGLEAGMMAAAAAQERERLATPLQYDDGTWDQPLLTPETVIDENEQGDTSVPAV